MIVLPGKGFQIAVAILLASVIAAMFGGSRGPAPAAPPPAPRVVKAVFAERFDLMANEFPLLKKQDRLPLPVLKRPEPIPVSVPVPVKTEPLALMRPEDEVEDVKPVRHHRHHEAESNICTRHHMHKVTTHGGRSWRCRR